MKRTLSTPDGPRTPADTAWTRFGPTKDGARLRQHICKVHAAAAGFTEDCASACKDSFGRDSYDWLIDAVGPRAASASILDLACGGGPLLERLRNRLGPSAALTGVDMSAAELRLAEARLVDADVRLHEGLAQDLAFAADRTFDAVLCHWALTLMDPLEPVFAEVARVLKPRGTFAAIVDGPAEIAPLYAEIDGIIMGFVRRAQPRYAELGDPRARDGDALAALAQDAFPKARVGVETQIFTLDGSPERLAAAAAGFFYAVFVLGEGERREMIEDVEAALRRHGDGRFDMPINRLVVRG